MLIKSADDRSGDVRVLEQLLDDPAVPAETRRRIEQEIKFILSGVKGEREAAYEIEFHFGASPNWAVIHDLRIEHNGRVAQIDHLVMNRFLDVWVCEGKRFTEGIAINNHGECSAFYAGKPYGVPSPFEQNRKHCIVLKSVLDDGVIDLPTRLGFALTPKLRSMVLVSKNARITRPTATVEGLEDIVKVDQVKGKIEKTLEADSKNFLSAAKLVSSRTLEDLARRIVTLHRPITVDWRARFGLHEGSGAAAAETAGLAGAPSPAPAAPSQDKGSKLLCTACGGKVSYQVARFCWFNKVRFGGNVFCIDCQKSVPAPPGA